MADRPLRSANRSAIKIIEDSGLFDHAYYVDQQSDRGSTGGDAIYHFMNQGSFEGFKPNFYFDPVWYITANSDVGRDGGNPLYHYIVFGEAEGRPPSILFDPVWYRSEYNVPEEELALSHYLRHRFEGCFSPLPQFDIAFYAVCNADVLAAGLDPFEHYIQYGFREMRRPSQYFDARWYANRYLGGEWDRNPFVHWLEHRHDPNIVPCLPPDTPTVPREIRRHTRPGPHFEEFWPVRTGMAPLAKVLAFYLPQFHSTPENDRWWGRGFTEWTNIARGVPRFLGHHQPRVPRDLGFYSLDEASAARTLMKQARMAQEAGLHGFIFYYYWFDGRRLLEGPIERLLASADIDVSFALMWANENWSRRWDGAEDAVLMPQSYDRSCEDALWADLARHFSDRRYIRLQGRPLLFIYRPGSIPGGRETIDRWRRLCRKTLGEDPLLFMAQTFGTTDPRDFGLDGAVEFPPHKLTQDLPPINQTLHILDDDFSARVFDYATVVRASLAVPQPEYPLIRTAVPSWDNDARRQGAGLVIAGSTPDTFERWLEALVSMSRRNLVWGEAIVCVNAWNEWTEGAYLEPDVHFGGAYLNAVSRAVAPSQRFRRMGNKLLLVGHDAFPSGAQILLMRLADVLRRRHNVEVAFLLAQGGDLLTAYRDIAPVTVLPAGADAADAIRALARAGFDRALLNTSVSGGLAAALEREGVTPAVLLVHEMPRFLTERALVAQAADGLRRAACTVFPAACVRDAVVTLTGVDPAESAVLPQGLYRPLDATPAAAAAFRSGLGVVDDAPLVLGVGHADLRKGFDLFLQTWRVANRRRRVHFCWVGSLRTDLAGWIAQELESARRTGTFHTPGWMDDIAPAYVGACAVLLTSREDPFPSVGLEALSVGKPVVAFAGTGGVAELLEASRLGIVVPPADVTAMADALLDLIERPESSDTAEVRIARVRDDFCFETYVDRLLALAFPGVPSVSVAIVNFNHADFLPERLASIFSQDHILRELLFLDDASGDDSMEVARRAAVAGHRDLRFIVNPTNSGSIAKQWLCAAEAASGEWLWIAEGDDSSDPSFVRSLLARIAGDPRVVMAFSDSRAVDADGTPVFATYKTYAEDAGSDVLQQSAVFDGPDFARRLLAVRNTILNVSSVLWRREALIAALHAGGPALLDMRIAADWRLYLQILLQPGTRLAYEANPLNVHRRHGASVTGRIDSPTHAAEVRACHAFARDTLSGLTPAEHAAQDAFADLVGRSRRRSAGD